MMKFSWLVEQDGYTGEIKVTWRRKEQATFGTGSILMTHECH
jgi:hypothetical protein